MCLSLAEHISEILNYNKSSFQNVWHNRNDPYGVTANKEW